jgi:hypothetical protein
VPVRNHQPKGRQIFFSVRSDFRLHSAPFPSPGLLPAGFNQFSNGSFVVSDTIGTVVQC